MAGRPPSPGPSAAARAHADAERQRYQSLPKAKRQAIVQTRDRGAQQAADNRRHARDAPTRNSAHTEQASRRDDAKQRKARATARVALATGTIKKAAVCQSCGKRPATQLHHGSYDKPTAVKQLCSTCHGAADRATPASGRG